MAGNTAVVRMPLEDWEIKALIEACQTPEEYLIIVVLLDTGMRISEWVALRRENIYADRGIITFPSLKKRERKLRQVAMTPDVQRLLVAYFNENEAVIGSRFVWYRRVKAVASRAGIVRMCSPHVLRHSFAVTSLRKGVNIRSVQEAMGHASLAETEKYLVFTEDRAADDFRRRQ